MNTWNQLACAGLVLGCLSLASSCGPGDKPVGEVELPVVSPSSPTASSDPLLVTEWVAAAQRSRLQNLDIAFTDQDGGQGNLKDLINEPVLVTFFYTRCQNNRKCSAVVSQLAELQQRLAAEGMGDKVRIVAITYEPLFDTPERLNRYGTTCGFQFGKHATAIQLDSERNQKLVDELGAPVSYNAGWVNTHGIELSLLDAQGRVVRKYQTLLWDNDQVVGDLRRMLAEP